MLPPEAMLKRLTARLPLLTGGARDLPLRQQTLRRAIAWSYELLTPDEQALFRRMGVFARGCTLEAIEAVVAGDELGLEVFDGLERLVDHSLVRQTETTGEPRFTMLETIREFGLEQLDTSGEASEAHQRHARYFVALGELPDPESVGPELKTWMDRMEIEHDNVRAACEWMLEHDIAAAFRLMGFAGMFWLRRGYVREGRTWLERVLTMPEPGIPNVDRARVFHRESHLAGFQNDLRTARSWGEEALAIFRSLGDRPNIARQLGHLSVIADMQGDYDRFVLLSQEAVGIVREIDDKTIICQVLNSVGYTAYLHGELERARTYLEEALVLARVQRDESLLCEILHSHAELCRADGDVARAESLYREGLATVWQEKTLISIVDLFQGLGSTAAAAQRMTRAARIFGAEAALRDANGFPLDPGIEDDHDRNVTLAREALGEEAFAVAFEAGAALSLEEAVAEALALGDRSTSQEA
jgi:tetratricopeptide (TPR) repeat protein